MPTRADTRRIERRLEPAKRKYRAALAPILAQPEFDNHQTFFEFKPQKETVEVTTMFQYKGERYRFDYEVGLSHRLPRVGTIRGFFWDSLGEYRKSQPGNPKRYLTVTMSA